MQGLDELTHLVWATRDGADEEDVIIFPAEAKFHKARALGSQCKHQTHSALVPLTPPAFHSCPSLGAMRSSSRGRGIAMPTSGCRSRKLRTMSA